MARGKSLRSEPSRRGWPARRLGLGAAALLVLVPVWLAAAAPASGSTPNALPTLSIPPTPSVLPSPPPAPDPSPPPAPAPSPSPAPPGGSGKGGSGGPKTSGGGGGSTGGSGGTQSPGAVGGTTAVQKQTDRLAEAARQQLGEGTQGCVAAPSGQLMAQLAREEPAPTLTLAEPPGMDGPQDTKALTGLLQRVARERHLSFKHAFLRVAGPFPVAGPAAWADDWHAYRPCPYPHLHEGLDIFAPRGTPAVAIANGVLSEKGTSSMSGNYVQITDRNGTEYFYDHFDAFPAGLQEGQRVRRGQIVGFVGDTGNARGTTPHLHLEVQPDGIPTPPKPFVDRWLLKALDRARSIAGIQSHVVDTAPAVVPMPPPMDSRVASAAVTVDDAAADAIRVQETGSSSPQGTVSPTVPAQTAGTLLALILLAVSVRRRAVRPTA